MMGVNDGFRTSPYEADKKKNFYEAFADNIKLYKLFRLRNSFNAVREETKNEDSSPQAENVTDAHFRLGMDAWAKQDYQNAEKIFQNVLKTDPRHEDAYFGFFPYTMKTTPISGEEKYKMAVKALSSVLRAKPEHITKPHRI
jgi:Tfp pilus assembly protein PilF